MASLNEVKLIGRIGSDIDVKAIGEDNKVAKFSLATSSSYKNKSGEKVEQTQWHSIVIWGKIAEVAEKYLSKGSQVFLSGKIEYQSWDDKDGVKKYRTEINCNELIMLGGKNDKPKEQDTLPTPLDQQRVNIDDASSDLPF